MDGSWCFGWFNFRNDWGALGWPSIDEMLCYAFFTIGFLLLLVVYLNGYLDCKNENESARALFYVYF